MLYLPGLGTSMALKGQTSGWKPYKYSTTMMEQQIFEKDRALGLFSG